MNQSCPIFASRTVAIHLLRGGAGFLSLACAMLLLRDGGPAGIAAVPATVLGLFLLRGCPMCWVVGLVETLGQRSRR